MKKSRLSFTHKWWPLNLIHMLQQSHSNKVPIRIDGIETFLDHPNHDLLISSMRKVSQKPEKINTVEELCGCNFPFFSAIISNTTLYFLKKYLFLFHRDICGDHCWVVITRITILNLFPLQLYVKVCLLYWTIEHNRKWGYYIIVTLKALCT